MGGEITYTCVGGNSFVFELVFYRDCNGAEINMVSENIRVWNHPTVTTINLPFVSRTDISPFCNQVSGGPSPFECGTGSAGGNGIGAIEKIVYRSLPINLAGIPPSQGWIFTYENYSRSSSITNLVSPSSYGITLSAKMFAIPNFNGIGCNDSSPKFLQEPNFVNCTGSQYVYNMHAHDPDLDSLVFSFGTPYDYFPGATAYNPPVNPSPVPFETGFSSNSPTPSAAMSPGSQAAQLNSENGEISFTSFLSGNYVIKISVKSFRNGVLISEVEREMQIAVLNCAFSNDPPLFYEPYVSSPMPFGGWSVTIPVGTNFNMPIGTIPNSEFLQDGSPQTVYLTGSGAIFGTNLSVDTGCGNEPCAYLNPAPVISNISSAGTSSTLLWQTDCNHLIGADGNALDTATYVFVFKAQDDVCPVPKITYATITIKLVNTGVIQSTQINCIETLPNGDVKINWNQVANPNNSFVAYKVKSLQGLDVNISDINTTSYTIPAIAINAAHDFYIGVQSGCDGNVTKYSDTVKNIHLDLINPNNGTAILQWNKPKSSPLNSYNSHYRIYREYPSGIFSLIDSTLYNNTNYKDTIDICDAFISYKIVLPTTTCAFTSNIEGDDFEDMITPDIPLILGVGADTTQVGNVLVTWNQNGQPDTYGYVVYTFDANGLLFELDTVWGWQNTSYSYPDDLANGPLSYSVAAFDSCYTAAVPVTYQTSAKANINATIVLTSSVQMCEKTVSLFWTPYVGRQVSSYIIWNRQNGTWSNLGSVTDTSITLDVNNGENYCFFIEAKFSDGNGAFSSPSCIFVPSPGIPSFHYFKLATIDEGNVVLTDYIDASVGIQAIQFERRRAFDGAFEIISTVPVNGNFTTFVDETAEVQDYSIEYRTKFIDSCGGYSPNYANINRTIHVSGMANEYELINNIQWNRYEGFNAGVDHYLVYRSFNGNFIGPPIAIIPNLNDNQDIYSYTDDINNLVSNTMSSSLSDYSNGAMCYRIIAKEKGGNFFGFQDSSQSNDFCLNYVPLVFIPNAFTPEALNPIFIPVITNVSEKNYSFQIFNRWGT
ncbi:MAG: hypothetical protein ACKO7P_11060, partial [Bacteroidota bacterium]